MNVQTLKMGPTTKYSLCKLYHDYKSDWNTEHTEHAVAMSVTTGLHALLEM